MIRIRPWLRSAPCAHLAGDPFELARVPGAGEYVRLAGELYTVGSVVHVANGDVAADVYMHVVEMPAELPTGAQLALESAAQT